MRRQLRQPYPMLPFDLLRIPVFSLSVLTSILSFTSQMLGMVALPFMFHLTFGMSAAETGLLMTAWPLVIVVAGPLAGTLATKNPSGAVGRFRVTGDECRLLLVGKMCRRRRVMAGWWHV